MNGSSKTTPVVGLEHGNIYKGKEAYGRDDLEGKRVIRSNFFGHVGFI